jgi:hypothetical protein
VNATVKTYVLPSSRCDETFSCARCDDVSENVRGTLSGAHGFWGKEGKLNFLFVCFLNDTKLASLYNYLVRAERL